ncbi:MAG: energy-coupling factor transporter ATPase [Clostridia bacterium]|nr:energy-coupling factor transporter ATPase [Clostridia bacterium]
MISVRNLNYVYGAGLPGSRQALFDINLDIETGDVVALIGHTGSGKSTLIQHFNALVPPTSGTVVIDGINVTDKAAKKSDIRKKVGLVFQYPEHQLFEETVFDDVAFGPKNLGLDEAEIKKRVFDACAIVGIKEKYFGFSPFELSGGQKRRVAIAGVIAMEPNVLVLDEPVAGLDPKGRDGILAMITGLHEQRPEMTIIFVSHSMEDVARVANHIIVMNEGSVAMTGTVAEVFSKGDELRGMGLAVPQITQITDRLRAMGYELPPHIYTLKYGERAIAALLRGEERTDV